jgi:hypothetical protein
MEDKPEENDIVSQEYESQKAIASRHLGIDFDEITSYPLHYIITRFVQVYGQAEEFKDNPDFDALAHYIGNFQTGYFNEYIDFDKYFNELVIEEKINLKLFNGKEFFKLLIDLAFVKYMTRKKAQSLAIMQQYREVIDSILEINFDKLSNSVKFTQKDLDAITSITLHGPKSGNIYLLPRVLDALKADQEEDQKYIDFAMRLFDLDEEGARALIHEYLSTSTQLVKIRKGIDSSFVFTLFKLAYYATRKDLQSKPSKARAYRFVFNAIRPHYPQLLSPEEYVKRNQHAILDNRSYQGYVTDTIKKLAKM